MWELFGILGISLLVVVHETGHYLAARAFGMRVLRYSIGLGPVLFKVQPKGSPTVFQISAIPFLAYVQIDGMTPTEDGDPSDPALFQNKSVLARLVTIFAGPLANYLAASLIVFGLVAFDGVPEAEQGGPMIVGEVLPGTPAAAAGLRTDDRIVEAEGRPVPNIEALVEATRGRAGQETHYVVVRDGARLELTITPRDEGGRGVIGVGPRVRYVPVGLGQALQLSVLYPLEVSLGTLMAIGNNLRRLSTDGMSGPVGMVRMASQQAERGMRPYINFLAVISVALGLFNLLPLPALDGGRMGFLFFELITRRRANERVEAMIHTVGLLLLLGLIVLVTFRDVMG